MLTGNGSDTQRERASEQHRCAHGGNNLQVFRMHKKHINLAHVAAAVAASFCTVCAHLSHIFAPWNMRLKRIRLIGVCVGFHEVMLLHCKRLANNWFGSCQSSKRNRRNGIPKIRSMYKTVHRKHQARLSAAQWTDLMCTHMLQ